MTNGSSSKASGSNADKWVNNYVPYGEYPSGTVTTVVQEMTPASSEQNGETRWKKNYVPYDEKDSGAVEVKG